jgi:hypothetical protein
MRVMPTAILVVCQTQVAAPPEVQTPAALQDSCDAGGKAGPEACYRLALMYREGRGVPKDASVATALALRACRGNSAYPWEQSQQACFMAFLWGEETWQSLYNSRDMWVLVRAIVQARDTEQRRTLIARTRDPVVLREFVRPTFDGITSLPDLDEVKRVARHRIQEIAMTDPDPARRSFVVGDADLSPCLSFEALDQIARTDPDPEVRTEAGRTLGWIRAQIGTSAEKMGIVTSSKDPEIRRQAVAFLSDQSALAKIAVSDPDETVRAEAAGRLDDQKLLARIAEKDKDDGVRLTATVGLTDQKALERLAKRGRTAEVRETAVRKVTSQAVIAEVAAGDSDPDVRFAAVKKLDDQVALGRIAKAEPIAEIRGAAVAKLTDPTALFEIALHDKDAWGYEAAIDHIQDEALLREVVERRLGEPKVVQHVARRVADQATLAMILHRSTDDLSCRVAAARLTDPALAAEVLATHRSPDIREILVGTVTDTGVLARVAASDANDRVRAAAAERLKRLAASGRPAKGP